MYTDGEKLYHSRLDYAWRETTEWFESFNRNTKGWELLLPFTILMIPSMFALTYHLGKERLKLVPQEAISGLVEKIMTVR